MTFDEQYDLEKRIDREIEEVQDKCRDMPEWFTTALEDSRIQFVLEEYARDFLSREIEEEIADNKANHAFDLAESKLEEEAMYGGRF